VKESVSKSAFTRHLECITQDHIPHATEHPPQPAPNVLPNAPPDFLPGRILLIKPGHPFLKSLYRRRRNSGHASLGNPISQESKSMLDAPDEGLVRVLLDAQFPERLVDQPNRPPQAPPRREQSRARRIIHDTCGRQGSQRV
jgi:hypothetical protein